MLKWPIFTLPPINLWSMPAQQVDPGAHYRITYKGIQWDPFRIAQEYKLNGPQITILKKVLVVGGRGYKDAIQDYEDIIGAAQRAIEMIKEDSA